MKSLDAVSRQTVIVVYESQLPESSRHNRQFINQQTIYNLAIIQEYIILQKHSVE